MDMDKLRSPSRKAEHALARRAISNILKPVGTLMQIAHYVGLVNHTTILHHFRAHEDALFTRDPKYLAVYRSLERQKDAITADFIEYIQG